MSIVQLCGFELGDAAYGSEANLPVVGGAQLSYSTGTVRPGGSVRSLRVNPVTSGVAHFALGIHANSGALSDANDSQWYVRMAINFAALPATEEIFFAITNSSTQIILRGTIAGSSGSAHIVIRDGAGAPLGTSNTAFSTGVWYLLDIFCQPGAGTGAFTIRVDGAPDTSLSSGGLSLIAASGPNTCGRLYIGKYLNSVNNLGYDMFVDDVAISNTGYMPDGHIIAKKVNADGATYGTGWTPLAGTRHDSIDDAFAAINNTDYITSTLADEFYSAAFESYTTAGGTSGAIVSAIKLCTLVLNPASATLAFQTWIQQGSTPGTKTTSFNPTSSSTYKMIGRISETDPVSTVAWTTSGLDTVEGVVQNKASGAPTGAHRVTAMYLMVDGVAPASPAVPTPLIPTASSSVTAGSVSFTWNAVFGATAYNIRVDPPAGVNLGSGSGTLHVFSDVATAFDTRTLVADGSAYTWEVRATNAVGSLGYSSPISFTVVAETTVGDMTASAFVSFFRQYFWGNTNKFSPSAAGAVEVATKTGFSLADRSIIDATFATGLLASKDDFGDAVAAAILVTAGQTIPTPISTDLAGAVPMATLVQAALNQIAAAILAAPRRTGTVTSDAANTATTFKISLVTTKDDAHKDKFFLFTSGANIDQIKKIVSSSAAAGTVTAESAFTDIPGADAFTLLNQ